MHGSGNNIMLAASLKKFGSSREIIEIMDFTSLYNIAITSLYFVLISSLGSIFIKRLVEPGFEYFISSLVVGSILLGFSFFILGSFFSITPQSMMILLIVALIFSFFQFRPIFTSLVETGRYIKKALFYWDKYYIPFLIAGFLLLILMMALAITPERAADAMRYHLAQLQDIVRHQHYLFRPYVCYNYPLYFGLLFIPVFSLIKGFGIKLAVSLYFLLSLLVVLRIADYEDCHYKRWLFLLMFLIPVGFHEAHSSLNDWVLIFYVNAGLLLYLTHRSKNSLPFLYLAFASLGFAAGIKYQALVFVPWFLVLTVWSLRQTSWKNILMHSMGVVMLMALVASPFYLRNYYYLHNPVWPLANHLFPSQPGATYQLALQYSVSLDGGKHSFAALIESLKLVASYRLIPVTLWIAVILGALFTRSKELMLRLGLLLFVLTWWTVEPILIPRYALFFLPLGLIMAVKLMEVLREKQYAKLLKMYQLGAGLHIILFALVAGYYSAFYIRYLFDHNVNEYHKYTWYYPVYDWVNHHTPENARFLVLVVAGQTYYLDRDYLRANPNMSAAIDWNSIHNTRQLLKKMKQENISYVIYSLGDLKANSKIPRLLTQLIKEKQAAIIYSDTEHIYASRIRNQYLLARSYVIELIPLSRGGRKGDVTFPPFLTS